jgi:hypothetical protein
MKRETRLLLAYYLDSIKEFLTAFILFFGFVLFAFGLMIYF